MCEAFTVLNPQSPGFYRQFNKPKWQDLLLELSFKKLTKVRELSLRYFHCDDHSEYDRLVKLLADESGIFWGKLFERRYEVVKIAMSNVLVAKPCSSNRPHHNDCNKCNGTGVIYGQSDAENSRKLDVSYNAYIKSYKHRINAVIAEMGIFHK